MISKYQQYSILIAEDDPDIRELLVAELKKARNIKFVITADDGIQASQRINNQKFDLLVLDYKLPKRTGLDILRTFKKELSDNGTKILFISGYLDKTVLSKVVQLGVRRIMVKPFSPAEFIEEVSKMLKLNLPENDL